MFFFYGDYFIEGRIKFGDVIVIFVNIWGGFI